jgi:hypothetical protein
MARFCRHFVLRRRGSFFGTKQRGRLGQEVIVGLDRSQFGLSKW